MKKIEDTMKTGFEVADTIIKHTLSFHFPELKEMENTGVDSKIYQLRVGMCPNISNALYARDKEVLENERLKTIVTLARTLKDKDLAKAIDALGYTLNVK